MKFTVTFKTPEALHAALDDASVVGIAGLSLGVREARREELGELCRTWFEYGEPVRIEIDTEAKTATVLPVER